MNEITMFDEQVTEESQDVWQQDADLSKVQKPSSPRLTVVEHIYHQKSDQFPTSIDSVFSRELVLDEQPWQRQKTVSDTWEKLDFGWIDDPGHIFIRNDGIQRITIPTPEQVAEDVERVLYVSFKQPAEPSIEIAIGESCRFTPHSHEPLQIRCRSGKTSMTVFCVPR